MIDKSSVGGRLRTYLANFDFDDRLAGRTGGSRLPPERSDVPSVAHLFRLLDAEPVRVVVPGLTVVSAFSEVGPLGAAEFVPADTLREADLTPWGWDSLAWRLAGRFAPYGLRLDTVHQVNGRKFAADIAAGEWTQDAADVLRRASEGELLMLKAEHGGFGRGLRRVLGPESDPNLVGWVRRHCRRGGLVVEPLEPATAEIATHFDVEPDGLRLLGRTRLRSNEHGQFVRSEANGGDVRPLSIEGTRAVTAAAEAVRTAGYRGPLSIDSARTLNGNRHVQDINARWSVGRLALLASLRIGGQLTVCNDGRHWTVSTPDGSTRLPGR